MQKSQKTLESNADARKQKYTDINGGKHKTRQRYLSNATHLSKTDPDARIAKKPGKPCDLYYSSLLSTDCDFNVITNVSAEHASKKDSRYLLNKVEQTCIRLKKHGLDVEVILADTGFSSGENYFVLKSWDLDAYIPLHGGYKTERDTFKYDKRWDRYKCQNGKYLKYKRTTTTGGYGKKIYESSRKDCNTCPFKESGISSRGIKSISHTLYREEYEEMAAKLKTKKDRALYQQRMHTVEPVFGTLQQHYGLRWINTRGKDCANKLMLMSSAALNLKKWMKNELEKVENGLYLIFFTLRCFINDVVLLNKNN